MKCIFCGEDFTSEHIGNVSLNLRNNHCESWMNFTRYSKKAFRKNDLYPVVIHIECRKRKISMIFRMNEINEFSEILYKTTNKIKSFIDNSLEIF